MAKCYWIVFGFSGFSPDSSPQIFSSFIVLFVERVSSSSQRLCMDYLCIVLDSID